MCFTNKFRSECQQTTDRCDSTIFVVVFVLVQLLLNAGDRITKPHDFHCKCQECRNRFKFDSLRHAQSRLNAYRGLASESYITLASIDPILTAFELGHELRQLSAKEKYFKV